MYWIEDLGPNIGDYPQRRVFCHVGLELTQPAEIDR
jgi:hypothetical protein